jgi:hypothetical protein
MVSFHLTEFMSFQLSKTQKEWLAVAKQYDTVWNFPHSLGATDEKHMVLQDQRKCQ